MDVLVVGAGPGGLATARGLLAAGHHVKVLERSSALRRGGAAVSLYPNGTAVLGRLGVPLDGLGHPIELLDSRDHHGRKLMHIDMAKLARCFGTPTLSAPRRQLVERLAASLPAGTIAFDAAVDSVSQDGNRARAVLSDGTTYEADVVIGADGHASVVRRQLWPAARTRPTGWITWQGLTPMPLDITTSPRILAMLGPRGFVGLQGAGGGLLQWYFSVPPAAAQVAPLVMLRERFAGFVDPVPEVLSALSEEDLTAWHHLALPALRRWGAGRLTLLGDAAHTMPPSLGQGVNQTLEDAYALTCALRAPTDVAGALREYETVRSRQVRLIARLAASERSTTYSPAINLLQRGLPAGLGTVIYRSMLERGSSVLADVASPRPMRRAS